MEQAIQIVLGFLAAIGGAALILAGLVHWLGKVWAARLIQDEKAKLDKYLESHRTRLQKSEFTFQKEYEAASELSVIFQSFLPPHRYPGMEFTDACDEMARDLDKVEHALKKFLGKYGAVLSGEHESTLMNCIYLAGSNKHNVPAQGAVLADASDAAEKIYDQIDVLRKQLKERVYGQVTT